MGKAPAILLLLTSGAYTSSGLLYPLSQRPGKQHVRVLGLLSLEW